jgi:hypothetical protein
VGILSFLGIGGGALNDKQIEKIAKLAANPFAQSDVRREQMDKLIRDGSEAAIRGLLMRLTVNASQAIADEDEKRFVVDELTKMGEPAVGPLKAYLRKETALTFALQALLAILPKEQAIGELLALFDVYGPDDYRADEQKKQVLLVLAEQDDPRILPALVPYLLDHADDVRHHVLELFHARAKKGDAAASAPDVLANVGELVRGNGASPRIARQAAEIAAEREWMLPGEGEIAKVLEGEYFIDKKGYMRRRAAAPAKK